ncbi:MAG: S41 family peptidase [Planctomycetota bacterium]
MSRGTLGALCAVVTVTSSLASHAVGAEVDLPLFPSISPDGEHIAFSWRGDLWKAPVSGGEATRLTSADSDETRSAWSPDGSTIAFQSDRDGYENLFTMPTSGGDATQVTHEDTGLTLSGFDGESMLTLFSRREGDWYRAPRTYRVPTAGGPIERLFDAFGHEPAVSPDGNKVVFVRGNVRASRRNYAGADNRDLWLFDRQGDTFTRLTQHRGNDDVPRWVDNNTIAYISDRDVNADNVWVMGLSDGEQAARRVTDFREVDVRHLDVARDGSVAVCSAWDAIYTIDLTNERPRAVELELTAFSDAGADVMAMNARGEVSEARLSPDGQVMATVAFGDVFVRHIDDNSPTRRVTTDEWRERSIAWSPDGTTLYFTSDRGGETSAIYAATVELTRTEVKDAFEPEEAEDEPVDEDADGETDDDAEGEGDASDEPHPGERWHDAIKFDVRQIVRADENLHDPTPSPDGTHLAYRRERGDIVVRNLETGDERVLIEHWDFFVEYTWAPDGKHIAYAIDDMDYNTDIWIASVENPSDRVNITRHPDNESNPRFSADGRVLAFLSTRVADELDVWMVFLDPAMETMSDADLRAYFDEATEAAGKRKPLPAEPDGDFEPAVEPYEIDLTLLDDAFRRLQRVTSLTGNESSLALTPGGDRVVFTADEPGGRALFSQQTFGERERERLGDSASVQHVSLKGDKVVYVRGGTAGTVAPGGGDNESLPIDFDLRINKAALAEQKFLEGARELGDTFYHPTMKGMDWDALTQRYLDLAVRTRTESAFRLIGNRFVGELAASHMGFRGPSASNPLRQANGRLGIDAEPIDGPRGPLAFRVTNVIENGPAATGNMRLQAGDIINEIEFETFERNETLESRLKGRVGEETAVTILRDGQRLTLLLTPIGYGAESTLRYEQWQRENRALVDEWSGGRLGYLHIRAMGTSSLYDFERDLFAAADGKDGLLIDVRSNGGGWTTDRILSSIMVTPHSYTIGRGAPDEPWRYPRDRLFIQRYTQPINVLCDEKSYSNAEILSHAFKNLDRGNLVGTETHGSVISTGAIGLVDGNFVRRPFRGWYLPDGTDMENNGAVPDVLVTRTPTNEARGERPQLRAAFEDLMKRLD